MPREKTAHSDFAFCYNYILDSGRATTSAYSHRASNPCYVAEKPDSELHDETKPFLSSHLWISISIFFLGDFDRQRGLSGPVSMDDDRNDHNMTDASNEQLSTGYHGAESPSYDKARIEASALVQNGRSRQTLRGNSGDESEDQTDLNALEEVPSKLSHEPEQHALLEGQGASGGLTSAKRSDNLASLPISALRSGICYDVRMRFHATPADDDHHPEDPRRIHAIYESIDGAGLVGDDTVSSKPAEREKTNLLVRIPAREASKEEICRVHNAEHYDFIEDTASTALSIRRFSLDRCTDRSIDLPLETLRTISDASDSVFFNKSTFFCAKLSAGGAIESCEAVISGRVKNAIAVIRPPGHHAVPHEAQGFCFFNNVCVAAKHCQDRYPDICRKILIFDW